MPPASPRFCSTPGCGAFVTTGRRCLAHAVELERRRPNVDVRRWYRLVEWAELRRQVIRDQANACAACGRVTTALEVDHIRRHDGDRRLFWDRTNLQALCRTCHQTKTQRGE